MAKQDTVITQKRRGPPPTGKGELIGVRLLPEPLAALDAWIAKQREPVSRPEAIRRLVEAGLATASSRRPFSKKAAADAAGIAGRQIDRAGDPTATAEERQSRKRTLLKGPEEFRDMRNKKAKRRAD
jgi:hypothetical protein